METLFLVTAVIGGTFLLLQFLAGAWIAALGHHDFGGHDLTRADTHEWPTMPATGSCWSASHLPRPSVRRVAFFGLGGLTAHYLRLPEGAAGGSRPEPPVRRSIYLVATLMKMLYRLRSDGSARINHAVGKTGTVYLPVPANKTGPRQDDARTCKIAPSNSKHSLPRPSCRPARPSA